MIDSIIDREIDSIRQGGPTPEVRDHAVPHLSNRKEKELGESFP